MSDAAPAAAQMDAGRGTTPRPAPSAAPDAALAPITPPAPAYELLPPAADVGPDFPTTPIFDALAVESGYSGPDECYAEMVGSPEECRGFDGNNCASDVCPRHDTPPEEEDR